jgi:crossover junction endodeoxyribonuclease RusA
MADQAVRPAPGGVWRMIRTIVQPHTLVSFVVAGDPIPKRRPRSGANGNTYTPKETRDAEKRIREQFALAAPGWEADPDATYGALIDLHTSAISKVDIDNAVKLIWDSLNDLFWADDIQAGDLYVHAERGRGEPRSEIHLFLAEDNGTPKTKVCACGTRYRAKAATCRPCWKARTARQDSSIEQAAAEQQRYAQSVSLAYDYIVSQVAVGRNPTYADIAIRVGTSEPAAKSMVADLIAAGRLSRCKRRYIIKTVKGKS